jgi:hypothetical protein
MNDFKTVIGKHKNKPCIVVGHGPSSENIVTKLNVYKENGFIIIGCNEWNHFYSTTPDYWLNANTIDTIKSKKNVLNEYMIPFVYANSVDLTDPMWVKDNIKTDVIAFDQRHFNGKKCSVCDSFGCIKSLEDRLTIQEELQVYTNSEIHYGTGDSIVVHMIAFAVLIGCNPIYVTGVDLDYRLGYLNNVKPTPSPESLYRDNIINDINTINESAKKNGTKIINLNLDSSFNNLEIGVIK